MTSLTFIIPKPLWLTANRNIKNRGYRQSIVNELHAIAHDVADYAQPQPIGGRVRVLWTVNYPKGVRTDKGDPTNAHPTTKALLDGLVDAGLIRDDGPKWVRSETFERGPNLDRPSDHEITVTITAAEEPA